jgi:hypothetical protein
MLKKSDYIINKALGAEDLTFHPPTGGASWGFDLGIVLDAVLKTNADLKFQFDRHAEWRAAGMVLILDNIPDKNMSGGVAECLGSAYCQMLSEAVRKNPHESGSPDFFPFFEGSRQWFESPTKDTYAGGGFDTKGVKLSNMRFMGVTASSHHTQTSSPLIAAWRYFDESPQIIGVFYTNRLSSEDWKIGSIPKDDGSKPTSSARLLLSGLEKVRAGWMILHKCVVLPSDPDDVKKYGLQQAGTT